MKQLNEILNIKHSIIMAPMFLVTNSKMMIEAMNSGIGACIPALNFRTIEEFEIGFSGLSIGSPFIACKEADVSEKYKQACVDYVKDDIVFTTKISGTPCTVINTPYVKKVGVNQNLLEKLLSKNKKLKKWIKMITYLKGMKSIEKAAFSSTYKSVWCAGPSIEHTNNILPVKEIIKKLIN